MRKLRESLASLLEKYRTVNIRRYWERGDRVAELREVIANFRCPNPEVEHFLHKQAIEFTRKSQSVTYLVYTKDDSQFVGYFTLAIKPTLVDIGRFSKTMQRQLLRVARQRDSATGKRWLAAYLVAQFGKNFAGEANERIAGTQLMGLALAKIELLQHQVGGKAVFLEASDNERLLAFYGGVGFKAYGRRVSDEDGPLAQLLLVL